MNRWHPPEIKGASPSRAPANEPAGFTPGQDLQFRALRDALERTARMGEQALAEAKILREELLCERLRLTELKTKYKELERYHNATTVGETEVLQKENRRLRTLLAETSLDRGKLMAELRARAPFERFEPSVQAVETAMQKEDPDVSYVSPEPAPSRSGNFETGSRRRRK